MSTQHTEIRDEQATPVTRFSEIRSFPTRVIVGVCGVFRRLGLAPIVTACILVIGGVVLRYEASQTAPVFMQAPSDTELRLFAHTARETMARTLAPQFARLRYEYRSDGTAGTITGVEAALKMETDEARATDVMRLAEAGTVEHADSRKLRTQLVLDDAMPMSDTLGRLRVSIGAKALLWEGSPGKEQQVRVTERFLFVIDLVPCGTALRDSLCVAAHAPDPLARAASSARISGLTPLGSDTARVQRVASVASVASVAAVPAVPAR